MSSIETKIDACRICAKKSLEKVMDFGDLALTGVFLDEGKSVPRAPLELSRCSDCGLVQLAHTYDQTALYGESYGYESHLNASMVNHLKSKARALEARYLQNHQKPTIVDIASNDGTLLSGYINSDAKLVGIDPLIEVVSDFYPTNASKIKEFFTAESYFASNSEKVNLVTSLSVLYDLDDPKRFVNDIALILEEGGIWHFEQSYLPTMVDTLSYDTICHEHLLYLTLNDIRNLLDGSGMQLIDASLNAINGGSIAVTAQKMPVTYKQTPFVSYLLNLENLKGYGTNLPVRNFAANSENHRIELKNLIEAYKSEGFEINALGASTKGNVLLQWLGLNEDYIKTVGDINPRKFGKQTPGTGIPIVDETQVLTQNQARSISIVLPWHFRNGIVVNCQSYIHNGGSLLFPLPQIEVVSI
jgi:hypothetical protein